MSAINFPNFNQQWIGTPTTVTTTVTAPIPAAPVSLGDTFKPKRAGKNKSHIIFVLDDSGSMQSCRDNTIKGFNEYLEAQKIDAENTGIETFVSLYKFDGSSVNCVVNHVKVQEANKLDHNSYNPRGGTNLLDAMGGVMMQINNTLSANKKADRESVIITVLTDGEENSSRTFRNTDIKKMVEKAEAKNWGFMFLGANINAFHAGSTLGFNASNTIQYTNASTANSMRSASAMTSRMKSAYSTGMDTASTYATMAFTDQERTVAMTKDDK